MKIIDVFFVGDPLGYPSVIAGREILFSDGTTLRVQVVVDIRETEIECGQRIQLEDIVCGQCIGPVSKVSFSRYSRRSRRNYG